MKREKETLMNHFSLEECFKFFVQEEKIEVHCEKCQKN
jgi:redox-regulated HSP33 family molecular chaperone